MITHYTLDEPCDIANGDDAIEYIYLPPFRIKSVGDRSTINQLKIEEIERHMVITRNTVTPYSYWKFVAEIPRLKPELYDKMLERIKVLINFL